MKGKLFSNEISTISCSRLLDVTSVTHKTPVRRPRRKFNCVPDKRYIYPILCGDCIMFKGNLRLLYKPMCYFNNDTHTKVM